MSDILYGDRLDVSIVLKSAHADLHHAKHDVALAFNKLLSRTTTHENFTARFGDMMAEGWLAWADEGEVCARVRVGSVVLSFSSSSYTAPSMERHENESFMLISHTRIIRGIIFIKDILLMTAWVDIAHTYTFLGSFS